MDKTTQALVDALKQALSQPGEQRLFRSGKLTGVFPGRSGVQAEAAARALREGLLEVARTETKGKMTTEWVRSTPRTIEFVHQHESPLQALRDLQAVLQMTQQGIPVWMGELHKELQSLGERLTQESERIANQIQALGQRVSEAIDRAKAAEPGVSAEIQSDVPWALEAVGYLEKRKATGQGERCDLPELFAALQDKLPELTLTDYHAGLRRLRDRKVLQLLPLNGNGELAKPEYALLDGSMTYYYAER